VLTRATDRVVDRLSADDALRPDVTSVQICRLAGGVAAVADQAELPEDAVQPLLDVIAEGLLAAG
jgi:hypothetical protein